VHQLLLGRTRKYHAYINQPTQARPHQIWWNDQTLIAGLVGADISSVTASYRPLGATNALKNQFNVWVIKSHYVGPMEWRLEGSLKGNLSLW
jgi:hypothetical protein